MQRNMRGSFFQVNSYADEPQVKQIKSYRIKILVLGAANVGKSSILYQYTRQRNPQFENPTVGTDFVSKVQFIDGIECHLQIWDTADYNSPSIPTRLYNGAVGFIIVYDITKKKSFDPVYTIMNDLAEKGDKNKQIFLVGNKLDRAQDFGEREVRKQEVQNFAKNRRLKISEISAKSLEQVEELFRELSGRIIEKVRQNVIKKEMVETDKIKSGRIVLGGEGFQKRYNKCC